MNEFVQEFTIHPVGQGLFYSGRIIHNGQVKFRMVFDCGSLTKNGAEPEIELYRKDPDFLKNKTLDLLVISHFDADHLNKVGKLLEGGIKVKKLVMPVVSFEERLFLIAQYISEHGSFRQEEEFALRFMVDPLTAMGDALDDDTDIYLVESGNPDSPKSPLNKAELINSQMESNNFLKKGDFNENGFDFDFTEKEKIRGNKIEGMRPPSKGNVYKVKDTDKASMVSEQYLLMDFLFYRRFVGGYEEEFFDRVKVFFAEEYKWNGNHDTLIEIVKNIRSAVKIKKILGKVKRALKIKDEQGFDIINPNTTALCMLHRNLEGIYTFLGHSIPVDRFFSMPHSIAVVTTHKFAADPGLRVEMRWDEYGELYMYREQLEEKDFFFPNAMLTSDAFLLTDEQVKDFLEHYRTHWNDFWLFQVPHHGSRNNSDGLLHSQIPHFTQNFINSGIRRAKHPAAAVLQSLIATGHGSRLIPVNEFQGLRFTFALEDRTK